MMCHARYRLTCEVICAVLPLQGYEIELARISDDELEEEEDEGEEEEPVPQAPPGGPKQPVEFDQAINYVNKIKVRARCRTI